MVGKHTSSFPEPTSSDRSKLPLLATLENDNAIDSYYKTAVRRVKFYTTTVYSYIYDRRDSYYLAISLPKENGRIVHLKIVLRLLQPSAVPAFCYYVLHSESSTAQDGITV